MGSVMGPRARRGQPRFANTDSHDSGSVDAQNRLPTSAALQPHRTGMMIGPSSGIAASGNWLVSGNPASNTRASVVGVPVPPSSPPGGGPPLPLLPLAGTGVLGPGMTGPSSMPLSHPE